MLESLHILPLACARSVSTMEEFKLVSNLLKSDKVTERRNAVKVGQIITS